MSNRAPGLFITVVLLGAVHPLPYRQLDPNAYQSFVENWRPASAPLCAAIGSAAEWSRVLRPAAVMRGSRPFGPPASFWKHHAVLLVARVIDNGDTVRVFRVTSVMRSGNATDVRYAFAPTPRDSSRITWWMAVAVARSLPAAVRFVEDGRTVCALDLARGEWLSPALAP